MSATTLPVPARHRSPLASTPGRMMAALVVIAALGLVSAITALIAVGNIHRAVQTIGNDTEPSVVAAQIIRARLAGMDAEAIGDSLTENAAAVGTSAAFRDHLGVVNDRIVSAAGNITFGETEAAPIRELVGALELYLESLGETRWMARDNPWLAVQRVRWSSRLMNDFVMPQAIALQQANLGPLERQYAAYQASGLPLGAMALAAFAAFLAALIGTQIFLLRRTRRLVNLPLAAATLLTIMAMAAFAIAMIAEQADMRAAKQDAFDSIRALYDAKAIAYELNAERSLWLLDPSTRTETAARFAAGTRSLIAIDPVDIKATSGLIDSLSRALEFERAGRPDDAIKAAPKFAGLLGDEMGNITFGVAERQPATDCVVTLLNYLEVDREIRRLEMARRHAEAVVLATTARPGGSVAAFMALDGALNQTIGVNEAAFNRRTGDALTLLDWMRWGPCAGLALASLLAATGLWQRWREYR